VKISRVAAILLFLATAQMQVQAADDFVIAKDMGDIVSGSVVCAYSVDRKETSAFVRGYIEKRSLRVRSVHRRALYTGPLNLLQMTDAERRAECARRGNLAKEYGFSK
jgi:hypothetical protein